MSPAFKSLSISFMAASLSLAGIGYAACDCGSAAPVGMSMTTKYETWGTLASRAHTEWYRSATA